MGRKADTAFPEDKLSLLDFLAVSGNYQIRRDRCTPHNSAAAVRARSKPAQYVRPAPATEDADALSFAHQVQLRYIPESDTVWNGVDPQHCVHASQVCMLPPSMPRFQSVMNAYND